MIWAILAHPGKPGIREPLQTAAACLLEHGQSVHVPRSLFGLMDTMAVENAQDAHPSAAKPVAERSEAERSKTEPKKNPAPSTEPTSPSLTFHEDDRHAVQHADIVLVIGGDGTLLHTAQLVKELQIPLLGINTGRLGFMANVQPSEIREAIRQVLAGDYEIDPRAMLAASFGTGDDEGEGVGDDEGEGVGEHKHGRDLSPAPGDKPVNRVYHALNEHLFYKKGNVSLITVAVHLDGQLLNRYLADGLLLTTPTGSTAYNLSAGGPIVMPGTRVMVVTPVSPHTLTTRPIVVPLQSKLRITLEESAEDTLYAYDGIQVPLGHTPVTVTASHHEIQLVRLPHQTYFKTLQNKLMWGLDRREKTK